MQGENSVYSNAALGLDLGNEGVTANDVGDADSGPNNPQNFPVLNSATTTGTQITMLGSLNSTASSYFRIEFFASTAQDPNGYGEGQTYLGFVNVTTDASGNATFNTTLTASVASGTYVSASATKTDATVTTFTDTSEFAGNVVANYAPVSANLAGDSLVYNEGDGAVAIEQGGNATPQLTAGSVARARTEAARLARQARRSILMTSGRRR